MATLAQIEIDGSVTTVEFSASEMYEITQLVREAMTTQSDAIFDAVARGANGLVIESMRDRATSLLSIVNRLGW